jgi:anti-anti-sigma regulatory factor
MSTNDKKMMGYDPLAWMSEDSVADEVLDELVDQDEMVQHQLIDDCYDHVNSEITENVSEQSYLDAEDSEIDMNKPYELPEDESSEPGLVDDVIESIIKLDTTLTIQHVVKLHEKIKRSYAAYDAIEINTAQVASIDTASLQLLVALKKDAEQQQKSVVFTEPSSRFIESAGLLGLLEAFEIDA